MEAELELRVQENEAIPQPEGGGCNGKCWRGLQAKRNLAIRIFRPGMAFLSFAIEASRGSDLVRVPSCSSGWGNGADCDITSTAKTIGNGCGLVT
jgi:hypothetical protein